VASSELPSNSSPEDFKNLSPAHLQAKVKVGNGNIKIRFNGRTIELQKEVFRQGGTLAIAEAFDKQGLKLSEQDLLKILDIVNKKIEEIEEKQVQKRYVVFKSIETEEGRLLVQEVFDYETQQFKLCIFNQKTGAFEIVDKFEVGHELWYPKKVPIDEKTRMPFVTLATKPQDYSDVKTLMNELRRFINKYADVKPEGLWFLAHFILHTWIYDISDYASQGQILGDWGSGKTRVYKLAKLLCYNAVGLGGGTSFSANLRLQSKFGGTLLVNEFELFETSNDANTFILLINNGFEKGVPIALSNKQNPDKQHFFYPFGPKLFTSRNPIENIAASSRLITIELETTDRTDIPVELPEEAYEEAKVLRNKLLLFRLKNWQPSFKIPSDICVRMQQEREISGRFKQVMLPMLVLASICGDVKEVDEVFNFYKNVTLEFKKKSATQTPEGILFNTIVELCNQENYNDDDYIGCIDENHKLVAITPSLLKKKTGFAPRTIAQTLRKIGMIQERTNKPVVVKFEEKEPIVKNKALRKWVFPSEKKWKEAVSRYYFNEQNPKDVIQIPEVLKSSTFIAEHVSDVTDVTDSSAHGIEKNSGKNEENMEKNQETQNNEDKKIPSYAPSSVTSVTSVTNDLKQKNIETYLKNVICEECKFFDRSTFRCTREGVTVSPNFKACQHFELRESTRKILYGD